ncbi:MAG: response regulator [Acidobacteriota bacterium]
MTLRPDVRETPARILIVDDERHNRQLLEVMLGPEGFELLTANNGEDALAMVAQRPPDLILLDIMMPGMDGYQVADRIKSNVATQNIPIIMITALDHRPARMLGLSSGAEDFLTKPVDRAELCVRVRNLLRLKAYGDHFDKYSQTLAKEVTLRTDDLVESEARFRQLAETIREVFFLVDPRITQVLYVSPAFEVIYGRSCESLYTDPGIWRAAIHADDRDRVFREIMPQGTLVLFDVEYQIVRPDGSERAIRARGFPIYNDRGEIYRFAGIAEDITERRTLEAQIRQASKMDAIGQLASGVAHDFNNLLTVILGFTELLRAEPTIVGQQREDLGEILKAAKGAAGLTKQLLAFSRQQVLHATPIDINALISDMTVMLGRLIGGATTIELSLAPALSLALGDRGQLEQVVMNLVINARDAMTDGGSVTIETANVDLERSPFHAAAVVEGPYVMIAITDTGTGMTDETRRHLFEPFFTTKEKGKGTGLGLSTTYGIVKQSKGYIWVYSELGRGTTFKVYLPRAAATVDPMQVTPLSTPMARRASGTVLLVEDEMGVRRLSKRILDDAGYHVLEAQSADEAEALFDQHAGAVDLIVTDVIMPGCGGPELVGRLKIKAPALRVLYMSGYTEKAAARQSGIDLGMPFVQKPFTAAAFMRQVRAALQS